jgi:peptide/nickel transport system substrate-binding protein
MNREPIGLYIFRLLLGIGLFALMCMLYWSSLLLEEKSLAILADVNRLKQEMLELRKDVSSIQRTGINYPSSQTSWLAQKEERPRPHLDPSLPNLLHEDPFYTETLPQILGPQFKPHGTFSSAVLGRPDNLHPFSNWANSASWTRLCIVEPAQLEFGKYETYAPDMAIKMEERYAPGSKVPEYWIHLRDQVYWEPLRPDFFPPGFELAPHFQQKHQVTAHDFKFYFDAMMNPYNQEMGAVSARTYWADAKEVEVLDELTLVVRWNGKEVEEEGRRILKIPYMAKQMTGSLRPLASFVYQYFPDGKKILEEDTAPNAYRTSSVWAQNFSQHWAKNIIPSCGAWLFEGMTDTQIRFKRNPDFYNPYAALAEGMVVEFKSAPDGIWQDFKTNKLDSYTLQPDQLIELEQFLASETYRQQVKKGFEIKRLDYLSRAYAYIGWNQARPLFKSKKVRQALTMAIDRQRIIREYLNGMGEESTGTFFKHSPSYDSTIIPLPFDQQEAKRILEEEGWYDREGSGVISNIIDGKLVPFKFNLTYYFKNPTAKAITDYVATALKEIGIQCNLKGVDIADLSATFDERNFDALFLAWALGTPPENPRQLWYSASAKEKGSSNAVGFSNAQADAIIDRLEYEYDYQKRIGLYHQFDKILYDEQPYTFLYTPKTAFLYREYLQNVFIPAERRDLIPGANIGEPDSSIFWLSEAKP